MRANNVNDRSIHPAPVREPGGDPGSRPGSRTSLERPEAKGEANPSHTDPDPADNPRPGVMQRPPSRPTGRRRLLATLAIPVALLASALLALRYAVPRPVDLIEVYQGVLEPTIAGPGTLDAINKASVSASIQGLITALHVDQNDVVHAGDVLAEVNARDLKAQLDASIASLEAARKAVEVAQADQRRAEATLANARSTLARQQELAPTGASSQSTMETAETSVQQAEADVAKAQSTKRQAEAQAASAAATVEANRAQLDKATIRAPIDGVVVSRNLNLGDTVSPGTTILEIADPSSVVLSARFDESAIAAVAAGQKVTLSFASETKTVINGKVLRIGRQVDSETREFTLDVSPDRLPKNWAIGQRGTAVVALPGLDGVLTVPSAAIARRDGRAGLWVVKDDRAGWRGVTLGALGGTHVEVIDGLRDGDFVITDPEKAFPFMRVRQESRKP